MDEHQLIDMFAKGTYDLSELKSKRFNVEIIVGFVDIGFKGRWTKHFDGKKRTGKNILNNTIFGLFKVTSGVWNGYQCVLLDYGPGFVSVKDYMRQVSPGRWLGVYEVGGHLKGWFRLTEVIK